MPISRPYRVLAAGLLGSCGLALASVFVASSKHDEAAAPPELLPALHAAPLETAFRDTLRKGETLSELLERARLDAADAHALIEQLRAQQDLRSLKPGAVIAYRKSAATGALRKLEMTLDPDHKVSVRNDGGTMAATVAEVPVRTDTAVLTGQVRTSLYQGLLDGSGGVPRNERERIADVLADKIFAWQVDFSRDLREGDRYRIMYERDVRPDGTARSGRILAVQFDVAGEDHEAYLFRSPDGTEDYYDARGGSLKRAFLRAPLEFRRISSVFSTGRYHPILHRIRAHKGIDYAAAQGTPVRAVGDGVIARAGRGGGYGNVIEIRHGRGYSSRYGHLRGFAPGIHAGTRVRQGQLIGFVGMTGLATGPHLHYEFHTDGVAVNPSSIKYLTGEPLTGGRRDRFRELVAGRVALMDRASGGFRLADAKTSAPRPDAE